MLEAHRNTQPLQRGDHLGRLWSVRQQDRQLLPGDQPGDDLVGFAESQPPAGQSLDQGDRLIDRPRTQSKRIT